MTTLSITLFGSFQATLDGRPVTRFESNKVRALLAYLAVEADRPHSRDELIGLLWPDQPDSTARTNLRQALANLRLALGDREATTTFISNTPDGIQFQRASDHSIDARVFSDLLARCKTHAHRRLETCGACVQRLQQAIELYRDDFLAHFLQSGSEAFEEWVLVRREHWHQAALEALYYLAQHHELRGEYEQALRYARRQLELDAWREEAHRQVMQALALSGQRSAALAQFETCRRLLREELGAEPARETIALLEKIKSGDLAPDHRRHNLPVALTPLIGRERELAEINQLLENPACRLLTLTGPGGIGKTRLALQAASDQVGVFADGVWLIELAALSDPTLLPQAVAVGLDVREQAPRPLHDLLIDFLKSHEVLLVLDNCEHLIVACAQLTEMLLRACPSLCVLATSREALNIPGEVIQPVLPLPTADPQQIQSPAGLLRFGATQLFVMRAQAAFPAFALADQNAACVAQICYQLDGLPLAIELAAAHISALPIEQIAARLDDRFNLLTNGYRTALPRQQTLRAAIDWSYSLLSDAERVLFRRLAVFAGGWTFDAANQVCTAERPRSGAKGSDDLYAPDILDLLRQLVDKSLVTTAAPEGEARYRMLETIREYAFDKLRDAGEVESVRNGHCIYFRALAESANQQPKSERVVRQNRLEHEHDNLRAALRWILEQNEREQALTFCNVLSAFWSSRGYWTEARTWYEQTIAASRQPQPAASISYAHRVQYGIALDKCGTLAYWQGDYATAREQLDEALAIKRELGDNAGAASVLYSLGGLAWYQDDAQPAQAAWEEALALHHELGDKSSIASLLWSLGLLAKERGDYDESRRLTQESWTLQRELNNRGDAGWALENLAWLAMIEGDYAESKRLAEESLAIRQELNDQFPLAWSFIQKGYLAWYQSDCRAARAALRQGLVIFQGLRTSSFNTCLCLTGFAIVDMTEGYLTRGVKLLGAIQGESERTGRYNKDIFLTVYNQAFEMAQTQLDADSFNAARKAGHAMTLEQAIEYALNVAG